MSDRAETEAVERVETRVLPELEAPAGAASSPSDVRGRDEVPLPVHRREDVSRPRRFLPPAWWRLRSRVDGWRWRAGRRWWRLSPRERTVALLVPPVALAAMFGAAWASTLLPKPPPPGDLYKTGSPPHPVVTVTRKVPVPLEVRQTARPRPPAERPARAVPRVRTPEPARTARRSPSPKPTPSPSKSPSASPSPTPTPSDTSPPPTASPTPTPTTSESPENADE